MGRAHQGPHPALYLLPLIAVSQFPLSSAHPFRSAVPRAASPSDLKITSCSTDPTVSTADDDLRATAAQNDDHIVWQICDGQIQAPYETWTGQITSVDGTSTTVIETVVTSYTQPSERGSSGGVRGTQTEIDAWPSTWTGSSWQTTAEIVSETHSSGTDSLVGSSFSVSMATPSTTLRIATTAPAQTGSFSARAASTSTSSVNVASTENSRATPSSSETSSALATPGDSDSPAAAGISSSTGSLNFQSSTLATYTSTSSLTVTTTTMLPDSALTSLVPSALQTATRPLTANATGSIISALETLGEPTALPFLTSVGSATATLPLVNPTAFPGLGQIENVTVGTEATLGTSLSSTLTSTFADNIFQMIASDAPPSQITPKEDHPVPPLGIQKQDARLDTNKFYANFFLGDQTEGTWTHPYSITWVKGDGESGSYGMVISHTERSQFGTIPAEAGVDAGQIKYFGSPVGLEPLVMSATELGSGTTLTTDSLEAFSVNVNLASANGTKIITFPLLQGMGFLTGVYQDGTPLISSGLGITSLLYVGPIDNGITYKYRASITGGTSWLIYVTPSTKAYDAKRFTLIDPKNVQGPSNFQGYIQIAKVPTDSTSGSNSNSTNPEYDAAAGVYATSASISGSVRRRTGTYTLKWNKAGDTSRTLLMWALPHHVQSFSKATSAGLKKLSLVTTTKGSATAVSGDSWTLEEPNLPNDLGFAPWSPETGTVNTLSPATKELLNHVAWGELNEDISMQTNQSSIYFDGKALAKFATICYTAYDLADNSSLAAAGLKRLQEVFALHVSNVMPIPIVYDEVWGGIVSVCGYNGGDSGCNFGNTNYNDHHFHYGYYVYAAAVIGTLNSTWLAEGTNKAWVNALVRDYANSVTDDPYFPFSRMFDWYHGHSWAHGLIATADGKDQESSSEDTMASYAIKLWGRVIDDANMEARGNLMLAIQARSLQNYYLYTNDNTIQPSTYIGNKVVGILFENKLNHITYFGDVTEYIQGIHMLPLLPHTPLIRTKTFVQEEWAAYFANGTGIKPAWNITGGWRGIVEGNQMFINPTACYNFFSGPLFNQSYLDSGASRTWYLAYSAALGGDAGSTGKTRRSTIGHLAGKVER